MNVLCSHTDLVYDFFDLLSTLAIRQMAVHTQHRLEPEMFSGCESCNEHVFLLDIARQCGNGAGVAHLHAVHTQLACH